MGADIKQLIFDWDDVTGAAYYRLLVKVGTGAFKPLIDNIPASTTQVRLSIAVHLLKWANTRYAVAACNTSGCTNSAAIVPQNLMLDSIGYFKASNTDPGDTFGRELVLSDDGRTLAVIAPRSKTAMPRASTATRLTTVRGNPAPCMCSVARATAGGRRPTSRPASTSRGNPSARPSRVYRGKAIAINADGSMLAVGASQQDVPELSSAGVVYIYQKSSSGSWSLAATLNSPTPLPNDSHFGVSVDMSLDGRTLKVNSIAALR